MKTLRPIGAFLLRVVIFTIAATVLTNLGVSRTDAALKNWINTQGGSWFDAGSWSPAGVPDSSDTVTISNDGTYSVLVQTGSVAAASIHVGGGNGTQTLIYGTPSGPLFLTNSAVQASGVLLVTNGGLQGSLLVQAGGQLQLDTAVNLFFYNFALTNQGTVSWTNGFLSVGGNNSDTTIISNDGLFLMNGNSSLSFGGGSRPMFINSGTVQKLAGSQTSTVGMDLINLPSGQVEVSSGTLQLSAFSTNVLGGSFTATAPGQMKFYGNQTDAGGTGSGSGTLQFMGGIFYLRTNTIPQIQLVSGDIYVNGNTFQQAGAITNLTLDGAQLRGTNQVAGTLTVNSGSLKETLTVLPSGQLVLGATGSLLYSFTLLNQGTVLWSEGLLEVGDTIISNGGTWTMTGDAGLSYGGGATPYFTNYGMVQKIAGTGISRLDGVTFLNQDSGIVSVSSGTIQMPNNYTNAAGTLQLSGGTLTAFGTLGMTGGQLTGTGSIGVNSVFDGGAVSPGQNGPGLLQFKAGLTLGSNASLLIDGTGTSPGTQYDQLSVTGGLGLSNCTLQVTSLPTVPVGTGFVIINNNGGSAVPGIFTGLPESSQITVGGRLFRIHYAGGDGNDVVLVSASQSGPLLSSGGYSNNGFNLLGTGSASGIYAIQATTNFQQWATVGTATADPSGNFNFVDTNAAKFQYRFYRTSN